MTPAEFKKKYGRFKGKEASGYQAHFEDLCRMLGQKTPIEADPSGADSFCYQKRVTKDAELFDPDETDAAERGFADVWKKGFFAFEYKGKKKNLDEAYRQLLRYRESLENPPLLVVCDFDRFIVRTNFNGTVQEVHEFTNDEIDQPKNLRVLRALFEDPEFLKPQRTTAQVTEQLARAIAEVAMSLHARESVELSDAKSRREVNVAQKKNLRIARFLNRIVFCLFAEDTGLLPKGIFSEVAKTGLDDPHLFAESLEELFRVMSKGGRIGTKPIRHFNGHLFDESTVFELTADELRKLADSAEADWQFIQPSIMGTLFERALDESQRAQLGAHYTDEGDIRTLVEPVLMRPLRAEWATIKGELAAAFVKGKGTPAQRERLAKFLKWVSTITVLDPACGSGNFLYVSLQLLLGLEKEVIAFASQLGFAFKPQVGVHQLRALELNPYAFELAQVSVQIGLLQWRRENGFDNDRTPVLQSLEGFQNEDALLVPHFRNKATTLKAAQAGEHANEDALKFYTEREWPAADVIVGNPPFLGDKIMRRELGDGYVEELRRIYGKRIPGQSDLCCYWFEKAREQIEDGKTKRAGLLATQGIRNGASREVLKRIKQAGDIFFAISDHEWVLAGANVNVSMIGFDNGSETQRSLDGVLARSINPNLTAAADSTVAKPLKVNSGVCFQGSKKVGKFEIPEAEACQWLNDPNPNLRPNSDVLRPSWNGIDLVRSNRRMWIVDFGLSMLVDDASKYAAPFKHVVSHVKPERDENRRDSRRLNWWRHGDGQPAMRAAVAGLNRFIVTNEVAKHRVFAWLNGEVLPDCKLMVIARDSEALFGILQSRLHCVWALRQGSRLQDRPCYTPTTCFETFPFPRCTPAQETAIAAAAKELNALRERWLNPPEWTAAKVLEFPGTAGGPWSRFLDAKTVDPETGVGTVRFPRLEPRDADCAAKLKKRTLTNLYNERPEWLGLAHAKLDAAVATAYGFPADLTDEQILERLLALNLERADEEAKAQAKKATTKKAQRTKGADELI